jgi:hypothetical protein
MVGRFDRIVNLEDGAVRANYIAVALGGGVIFCLAGAVGQANFPLGVA